MEEKDREWNNLDNHIQAFQEVSYPWRVTTTSLRLSAPSVFLEVELNRHFRVVIFLQQFRQLIYNEMKAVSLKGLSDACVVIDKTTSFWYRVIHSKRSQDCFPAKLTSRTILNNLAKYLATVVRDIFCNFNIEKITEIKRLRKQIWKRIECISNVSEEFRKIIYAKCSIIQPLNNIFHVTVL